MANLIERKRRRRRKGDEMEETPSVVCLTLEKLHQDDEINLRLSNHQATTQTIINNIDSLQENSRVDMVGQEECEYNENGIKQQTESYNCSLGQKPKNYSLLTSAIHRNIMGQKRGRSSSLSSTVCRSSQLKSLSLLLLLSIAFTFTLSPLPPMNLIQLTEATGNNNNNQQQQQQQRQMSGQTGFGGGNTVIMAPSSPAPSNGKARYKTIYACEDTQLTMDCDFGSKINLIRANFGRFSITQCNEQGQLDLQTDCMSPITFRIMQERCQDKRKCSVNATSSIFGDKCPKTRKYLEVHFQCQQDQRQQQQQLPLNGNNNNNNNNNNNYNDQQQPDRVDLRNSSSLPAPSISHIVYPQTSTTTTIQGSSPILPPNNPPITAFSSSSSSTNGHYRPVSNIVDESLRAVQVNNNNNNNNSPQNQLQQPQQPVTVMNSEIVSYNAVADTRTSDFNANYNNNNISQSANEQIIVTLRHFHTENMSNPRCVLWDQAASQWVERGSRIVDTNSTHTICAFDQATSYLLVMDYLAPANNNNPTISQLLSPQQQQQQQQQQSPFYLPPAAPQPSVPGIGSPIHRILDFQPVPLDSNNQQQDLNNNKINQQQQQQQSASSSSSIVKFFSLFGYLLAIVFVAIAFITIAFIASTMRTSGTTLKSLGNFTAFGGPKYKNRRTDEGLHNKDLLVINNQNGHQFLYAPASTTKISSNSTTSTHILPANLAAQGTLHHHIQQQQLQQQQQMYSGTNGTLSNLSATGGQSNYYYGLMGSLFQQQQQQQSQLQHHLSTLHLNNQQHQMQQGLQAANYQHQTDKSTISNESANSTPSSSGVESASTSLHQQQQQQQQHQQQQQQQQSCLMMNSEYNLMGQGNYYNHQHYQPQLTLNAHYSSSGPMNMGQQQQQQQRLMLNNNNNSQLIREHIYESVDDDKQQCMARAMFHLSPQDQPDQLHQFNANTLGQQQQQQQHQHLSQQQANLNRAMTLSSRLVQNAINHQQPLITSSSQASSSSNNNKRLNSHPAIVRDSQTKTNISCSKLAQVTPQRATEINKFQHDIMAIFNGTDTTTTTTTANGNASGFNNVNDRSDLVGDLGVVCGGNSKVSTDC